MLGVTALLGVAAVIGVYWGARVAMGFGRDLRSAIFSKVETFSQVEVNRFGPATLITRNTNDVQQVQTVVFLGLTILVSAPILIVGGVIMALRTDVPLSGLLVVVLPLMAGVIGLVMSRAIPLFRAVQEKLDRINQVMRETLAGVRVIRAFVRTPHEEQRFDAASRDLFDTSLRVTRLFAVTIPTMTAIFNLSTVAVIWFGAMRINDGELSIGNLTAFMQYLAQILFAVLTAVFMFILIPRGAVSAGRIREVLDTEPMIREPESPMAPSDPARRGEVVFDGVEFRYPGAEQPVLHDIAFRAGPGETTAIVGSTGSGKSTLINLIPRFYDATDGLCRGRRRRRQPAGLRGALAGDRHRPAEGVPVRRHGREQPALRRRERYRRRALACPRDRAGQGVRRGDGGRPRGTDHPGRLELSRAGSARGWRSPGRSSRRPASTSSTTASRPSTSTLTPG